MTKALNFVKAHGEQPNNEGYSALIQDLLQQLNGTSHEAQDDGSQLHTFDDGSRAVTKPSDDETSILAALFNGDNEDGTSDDDEDDDGCEEELEDDEG